MDKLLELEKKLREAKEELEKIGGVTPNGAGTVASTGGTSIASQIGFGKAEDEDKKKKKNPDAKEDAELGEEVEHAVERHFKENKEDEEKEGHDLTIKKSAKDDNKWGNRGEAFRANIENSARQPATVTEGGKKMVVAPETQVSAQVKRAGDRKAKAEAEAAARRAQYRKEGVLKADDMCKSDEAISFNGWGQWSLEKSKDMEVEVESDKEYNGDDQPRKGQKVKREKL